MKKIAPFIVLVGLASGCGGQRPTGSPNDPNEQQGNPKAQPEKSATGISNKQPANNKAGRNAHSDTPHANDNK